MNTKLKSILAGGLMFSSLTAHAQSGAQGGGNFSEIQMKDFMGELSRYFVDPQSHTLFPEVDAWEKASGAKFVDLIQSIEPKVVNHKVYGPFGEERDCVSQVKNKVRYFECNQSRIPEASLENQPLLYSILLHEIMVHAGIEKPTNETIPSKYPVSSRMGNTQNLSLVTYKKWVPGVSEKISTPGIECEIVEYSKYPDIQRRIVIQAQASAARMLIIGMNQEGTFGVEEYLLKNDKVYISPDSALRKFEVSIQSKNIAISFYAGVNIGDSEYFYGNFSDLTYSSSWQNSKCYARDFLPNFKYYLSPAANPFGSQNEKDKLLEQSFDWLKQARGPVAY